MTTPILNTDTFGTWLTRINEIIGITNGLGTSSAIAITGGTINGTTIGLTTPASAAFTNLTSAGTVNFQGATIQFDANSLSGLYIGDGTLTSAKINVSGGNLAAWQSTLGVVSLSANNTFTGDITFSKDTTLFAAQTANEGGQINFAPGTTYSSDGNTVIDSYQRTIRMMTNNTQSWTFSISNSGTGTFSLDVEGSVRSSTAGTFVGNGTDVIVQPTPGTTAMTVKSSKRVGIGEITSPQAAVHADTATAESNTVSVLSTDYAYAISAAEGGTNFMNWGICSTWGTTVQAAINPIDLGSGGAQGWAFYTGNNTAISQALLLGADQVATFGAQARVADGTVSLPGFSFSGDTNTGIWRPAADTLEFVTGGSPRGRFSDSGHFMVGTSTPQSQFTFFTNFGAADGMTIRNTNASGSAVITLQDSTFASGYLTMACRSTDIQISSGGKPMKFLTGASAVDRMIISETGAISFPNATSFDLTVGIVGGYGVIASTNPYINFKTTGAGTDLKNIRIMGRTDGMVQIQKVNDAYTVSTDLLSITNSGVLLTGTRTTAQTGYTTSGDVCLPAGRNVYAKNTAKFWVNFNGTGTVAIRNSFNVSSITDRGTGQYTVHFQNAMADANYSWFFDAYSNNSNAVQCYAEDCTGWGYPIGTTEIRFTVLATSIGFFDSQSISAIGFGS